MKYNISFEVSALAFLLVVIGYFFMKRKYINLQGKIYAFYVLFIFFNIFTNLVSVALIEHAQRVPLIINHLVNAIYMCCQLVIPSILLLYILSLSDVVKKHLLFLFSLPVIFGILMVFFNPMSAFYFYFNEQYMYIHGVGHFYLYINAIFYLLFSCIFVFMYRKRIGVPLFYTLLIIILILIGGMIYQVFHPKNLITGTGAVLTLLMLYLVMENPDIYSDPLSGALNEEAFKSKLKMMYEHGNKACLVLMSMKEFKMINDVFGRNDGDAVLKQIAEYLIDQSDRQRVFRINGDVFVILVDSEAKSIQLVNDILERLKDEWLTNQSSVRLAAYLAMIHISDYHNNEELFVMLEYARIEMKKKEENAVYYVDNLEREKLIRIAKIKRGIANCISNSTIEMSYQPIYYGDGRLRALEALARMDLVEYGKILPDEFIKIAEMDGTILQLSDVIIKEVLDFIQENSKAFEQGLIVGINLSMIQIMKVSFAKDLLWMLKERNINHRNIVFEITETAILYTDATVIENIQTLRKVGLKLVMDDYGAGYANINNMVDIPFTTIKLDKQFVWNSLHNAKARIILINTVKMLQELDFDIVAEGIETKEQLEELKLLSINLFQGFYYTEPVASHEIWDKIKKIDARLKVDNIL